MRIIAFPRYGIAYTESFYNSVEEQGIPVIEGNWEGRWLLDNLTTNDVIHFHWPSFLYTSQGTTGKILKNYLRFIALLMICRIRSGQIWWTAHNLYPHNSARYPKLDRWARKIIIRASKGILVHSEEAQRLVEQEFPEANGKCLTIPHGNWIDDYSASISRVEARNSLGIAQENFVYLLFGQCQPYKNITTLVDAFRSVASENDHLVIAGRFNGDDYLGQVLERAQNDSRIKIENRFIPEEEVSHFFEASDVMCIPYNEILTSGSAMLAIGFGVPVVSINKGFLKDVISSDCGILINETSADSIKVALHQSKLKAWNRQDIKTEAEQYKFSDAARIFSDNLLTDDGNRQ